MRSRIPYISGSLVLLSLVSCTPPGGDGKSGQGGGGFQFIFLGLMIVVFWLFFIRPQAKKAKDQKKFIEDLQKGEKVVTIAGIHGTVNKVNEDGTLSIEVSPGSYIKIERSAISMEWTNALNKPVAADKK
ncbi:MAG: preprotein translocase subunit YajC [Chitinophagaceae bacterium]|nr:preprotein translocase subunit YajC [Chitinophagaceae bacterium]